ncbi:MAG: pantoate--beta-alanine ligase [Bacteroidaceae bacterium]|nr:pantoate--beta-alanine ligase [Bacteroidaceae bacterium]
MERITTVAALREVVDAARANGKSVGLVPTMGALHVGHISLVERCVAENDITVVSVFVNPTQFNDKRDLELYPRTPEEDCAMLEKAGCTYVFTPSVEEVYPEPDTRVFELGTVAEVMEGRFRPGHFNGVAQIVSKLFAMVSPHRAYFGEKDFQQIAVIRAMAAQLQFDIDIIACPIVREEDGLALSSRNTRLTAEQRRNAPRIAETLFKSRTFAQSHTVEETIRYVVDTINTVPEMRVEYYEIVDGNTLLPVENWSDSNFVVGCITVYNGEVRLIDNIAYCRP